MSFIKNTLMFKGYNFEYYTSNKTIPSKKGICFFVHGLGDTCGSFSEVIAYLKLQGYFVVFFDLPGCGINKEIYISFDECIELLDKVFINHNNDKCYFFGHSLGGLLLLLTLAKYNIPKISKVITIEPSITVPDYKFFKSIKMSPDGIGHEGLLYFLQESNPSGYLVKYIDNLSKTNILMFNMYVDAVNSRFETMRDTILSSKIEFLYFYGENSIGAEERKQVAENPNVTVLCFKNSEHWVHHDAKTDFLDITSQALGSQLNHG